MDEMSESTYNVCVNETNIQRSSNLSELNSNETPNNFVEQPDEILNEAEVQLFDDEVQLSDDEVQSSDDEVQSSDDEVQSSDDEMQLSDDESTISIDEISEDEYSDDADYDHSFYEESNNTDEQYRSGTNNGPNSTTNGFARTSSGYNSINNELQNNLRRLHPSIVSNTQDKPALPNATVATRRTADLKASVAVTKCTLKRKRRIEEDEMNTRGLLPVHHSIGSEPNEHDLLKDYGIVMPKYVLEMLTHDTHIILNRRYIVSLPARKTVYDIFNAYTIKKNIDVRSMEVVLFRFDELLPKWLLHRIEELKHQEVAQRYPHLRFCQIYGLSHLIRFIGTLPILFKTIKEHRSDIHYITEFITGFMSYVVEEDITIRNCVDYENVMPDYYRMTYGVTRSMYQTPSYYLNLD